MEIIHTWCVDEISSYWKRQTRQESASFCCTVAIHIFIVLLSYRTQLCINTAIVYMQRFYMFHSFLKFHRNNMASAALFLAAKVEEQPRKLEHVIKVAHICLHRDQPQLDTRSEVYQVIVITMVSSEKAFFVLSSEKVFFVFLFVIKF